MKIIVSHDIDHLTAWEHKNLLIPKFLIRATIEYAKGIISTSEYLLRYKSIIFNKWQNLEEIMNFDKENNIPATFFIGVNNGMGLDYPLKQALKWAQIIHNNGFDIGVHGIEYCDYSIMKKEYNFLYNIVNDNIGIRMHYLRNDPSTFKKLSKVGYLFDSTIFEDKNPYKINNMWEFPLHIMEVNIFYPNKEKWLTKSLKEYKEYTKKRIKELNKKNINYLTLLFHDRYFDKSHIYWRDWYIWVINYLKNEGHTFISYKDAIKELNNI